MMHRRCGELRVEVHGGRQARFELVDEGHEGVDLGDDAVLFGEGGIGMDVFRICPTLRVGRARGLVEPVKNSRTFGDCNTTRTQ